jgi:hypothetical protein
MENEEGLDGIVAKGKNGLSLYDILSGRRGRVPIGECLVNVLFYCMSASQSERRVFEPPVSRNPGRKLRISRRLVHS